MWCLCIVPAIGDQERDIKERIPIFCTGSSDYWRDGTGRNDGRTYGWNYSGCDFALFLYWMVRSAKKSMQAGEDVEAEEIKDLPIWKCLVFIGGGLVAIVLEVKWLLIAQKRLPADFGT